MGNLKKFGFIPLDERHHEKKAKITSGMKALLISEHSFTIDEPCPLCALELDHKYDDVKCLCGGDEDMIYRKTVVVPWDLQKKIYQDFATIALNEISSDKKG